jgi:hypothetical protein
MGSSSELDSHKNYESTWDGILGRFRGIVK